MTMCTANTRIDSCMTFHKRHNGRNCERLAIARMTVTESLESNKIVARRVAEMRETSKPICKHELEATRCKNKLAGTVGKPGYQPSGNRFDISLLVTLCKSMFIL